MTVDVFSPGGAKLVTVRDVGAVMSADSDNLVLFLGQDGSCYTYPSGCSLRIYNEKEKVKNGGN